MTRTRKSFAASFFVGVGLAVLFGILAGATGGGIAYVSAAVTCGVVGAICGVIALLLKG